MPWKETGAMDERIRFLLDFENEEVAFAELCRRYGICRTTGYKWLRRYRENDSLALLCEKSRRPLSSPNKLTADKEASILRKRQATGWGARKLQLSLGKDGLEVSVGTISKVLKRNDMVKEMRYDMRAVGRFERSKPNELLQMDFKGPYETTGGKCYPLVIIDDCSRYCLVAEALSAMTAAEVHKCLVKTFMTYGVPEGMLMDHGSPWWNTRSRRGLTWLTVFLINQGIQVSMGRFRHPQTQGKVERLNRTLGEYVQHHGVQDTLEDWNALFEKFRIEYNDLRPHQALNMEVPSSKYVRSPREYMPNPPPWDYPEGATVVTLNTQGCMDYNRRRYFVCEALTKQRVMVVEAGSNLVVSYRNMHIREIDIKTGKGRAFLYPRKLR